jgi:hypothetical protein
MLRLQWLCRVQWTRNAEDTRVSRHLHGKTERKHENTSASDTSEIRSGLLLNTKQECQYWSCIAQPCYPCSAGDVVLMWCDVTFCCGCELPILTSGRTRRANLPAVQWDWADKHSVHSVRVREVQVRFHKRPGTWTWGFLFIYFNDTSSYKNH